MRTAPRTYTIICTRTETWTDVVQAWTLTEAEQLGHSMYPDCRIDAHLALSCPHCGSTKIRYYHESGGDAPEVQRNICLGCNQELAREDLY